VFDQASDAADLPLEPLIDLVMFLEQLLTPSEA
jgi:hypothetical protein